jgi:hypothetical protein
MLFLNTEDSFVYVNSINYNKRFLTWRTIIHQSEKERDVGSTKSDLVNNAEEIKTRTSLGVLVKVNF